MPSDAAMPGRPPRELASVPPEESIGYQVRRLDREMTGYMTRLTEQHGISEAQWGYLRHLYYEDGLSQRELSDRVDRQGATTVTALKRMEQAGHVSVRKDRNDQRKNRVFLTPKGRRVAADLMPYVLEVEAAAFRGFSEEEVAAFWDAVLRIRGNLDRPAGRIRLVAGGVTGD